MDHEIIKEAIGRIRGLPTFSRIRDELRNKFALSVEEEELRKRLDEMMTEGTVKEKEITIKGARFKGYTTVKEEKKVEREEKTREEEIIDDVFG